MLAGDLDAAATDRLVVETQDEEPHASRDELVDRVPVPALVGIDRGELGFERVDERTRGLGVRALLVARSS